MFNLTFCQLNLQLLYIQSYFTTGPKNVGLTLKNKTFLLQKIPHTYKNTEQYNQLLCISITQFQQLSTHGQSCFFLLLCVLNCFSLVRLFETLWTVVHQTPLCMGFSRQEYQSGLQCPGIKPDPGNKPESLSLQNWQAGSLPLELPVSLLQFSRSVVSDSPSPPANPSQHQSPFQ